MNYHTTTLPNGLRVIFRPSASPVVFCGYQIRVGSRCEEPGEEGLAHFCEHVTFKGTERRKAWNVLNRLESVGGDLNAYTNKEDTTYYAAVLKEHVARAIDLLTDIVFHSTYPQAEIDKEVEVICDEIESYNDTPAELIFDDFENIMFKGHPLGHNILGTATNVRSFNTDKALRFARKHYRPDNAIFFVYGDVEFKKVVQCIQAQFAAEPTHGPAAPDRAAAGEGDGASSPCTAEQAMGHQPPEGSAETREAGVADGLRQGDAAQEQRMVVIEKGTHQAHVMVGTRGYSIHDKRRMALYLLNNILGGPGMNARFNIVLREHRGLVYTVESSMVSYSDTGLWCTYFGCDHSDVGRCLRLIRRELNRYMLKPISDTQLRAAKKQIKGQIGVACDNRESFALDFGKSFLHYGWEKDVNKLFENIDAITAEDIQAVAKDLFAEEKVTTLVYR